VNSEDGEPDLVELTRGTLQAANRRDWDALMSLHPPDSVWDASRFDLGIYEGPAEIRGLFESWVSAYDEWEIELGEVVNIGHGVVLVVSHQKARLAGSAAYLEGREALLFQWLDGKISRVTAYPGVDEARAAAERLALGS
jgi:ketosteroid isomerase-like protein